MVRQWRYPPPAIIYSSGTHFWKIIEHASYAKKIPVWAVRLGSRTLNSKKEFKKYFESGLANI